MSEDVGFSRIEGFALKEVELLLRSVAMSYASIVSRSNLRRSNDYDRRIDGVVKDILLDFAARVHVRREQAHEKGEVDERGTVWPHRAHQARVTVELEDPPMELEDAPCTCDSPLRPR